MSQIQEPAASEQGKAKEVYAKATVANEARILLEEFHLSPTDFGLEASPDQLGKGNTINPTDDWDDFVPGKTNPRVWNMDREEDKPVGLAKNYVLPKYEAKYKTVEYENFKVTLVAKPYVLRQKDSNDTEHPDIEIGEYYRDYEQRKIGLLIERTKNFEGVDISAVYVRARKGRENDGTLVPGLKHDIIVYAQDSENNKAVRYVWLSGFPRPTPSPDPTVIAQKEQKQSQPSKDEPEILLARMRRLMDFRQKPTAPKTNEQILPTHHPTLIPTEGTLAVGMESSVFAYLLRYKESPLEGTKHLAQFIFQNEPLKDFSSDEEQLTVQNGLKLLAERGAGGTEPADAREVRVAMEQIVSESEKERINFTESSRLLLGILEPFGYRRIYRDFLMKNPFGKISDQLEMAQILSFGVGILKGMFAEQWSIFERFRTGFQVHREHLNRRLTVGAISKQILLTDEYQTRNVSVRCDDLDKPSIQSPIRSIQFAEEERLGRAVRVIAIKVDFPGRFRGTMTLILGSDNKRYENFHVEELYKDYFAPEETWQTLGIIPDTRRLTYEIEKIPDFMKNMLPNLYLGYTYENMRPRALKAIKLLDSGKNTMDLSETILDT